MHVPNWRTAEPHPLAAMFPRPTEAEFQALVDDMKQNGYDRKQPITMVDGKIGDGISRRDGAIEAGVEPTFDEYKGNDLLTFVICRNLHRRHLTTSQRQMLAADLANLNQGKQPNNPQICGFSQERAAEALNVSTRGVQQANSVKKDAEPEVIEAVRNGTIAVSDAAKIKDEPPKVQRAAVKDVATGKAPTAAAAASKRTGKPPAAGMSESERTRNAAAERIARQSGVSAPDTIECPHCHGKGRIPRPVQVPFPDPLDTKAFREAWDNWLGQRRQLKIKPYTEIGAKQQLAKLAEMGVKRAIAAIEFSIGQGYQGIFEPSNGGKNGKPIDTSSSRYDPAIHG